MGNGPDDNPDAIIDQLERSVGPGNYHVVIQTPVDDPFEAELDSDEASATSPEEDLPGLLARLGLPFGRRL